MNDLELEVLLADLGIWAYIPADPEATEAQRAWLALMDEQVMFASFGWKLNALLVGFLATFTLAQRAALSDAIHEGRVVFNWSTP